MTKRLVTPALAREKLHGLIFLCLAAYSATCIISITLCEIFFVLALLLWAADAFAGGRKLSGEFNTYLTLPLAVFAVIHIIAAILGIDPANSIRDSRKLYLILMFFVAAKYLDSLEKIEKIVMFFAAGSLFIGAYAVCSSISAAHAGNAAGFRAASFSGTPMHLGGMLTMSVVFLFTVIAGRIKKGKIKGYFTLFAFFALILSVAGLMLTYTRSAWLASAVGIVIAAFFTDKKLFAAVLIVFALSVFALKDTSVGKRVADAVSNTTTNTAVERILMWKSGLKIIRDNPVHGIGTANVGLVYPKYRDKKAFEPNQGHLHNNIIQVAAIDGIPGAAAILWMFVLSFFVQYRLFIKLKGDEKQYILSILAVNVSFFINGLFEYNLFSSQVVLMYWFFMGISAALYGKKEQKTVQA